MKALLKLITSIIFASFLVSCSSTAYLRPIESEGIAIAPSENGGERQIAENEDFTLYAEAIITEDDQSAMLIALDNHKSEPLIVSEENIRIYGRNGEDEDWSYLGHWSKESYLSMLSDSSRRTPPVGSVILLSWLLDDSYYSFDSGYGISIEVRTPSVLETAAALSILSAAAESERSRTDAEVLRDSLFATMQIKPGERRGGIIFFPINEFSYYKVDVTAGNKTESLNFARIR